MANLAYDIRVSEIQLDENGNELDEITRNLPHADLIAGMACSSWNALDFPAIVGGHAKGGVERAPMSARIEGDGALVLRINVIAKKGFRLSERRRQSIFDELDAQMSDGWGEGFFGYGNVITDGDGNQLIAETALS